jgi:hypothetical protein
MRLILTFAALFFVGSNVAVAIGPCQLIHGRATYSSANGMFRIWHIGTHHTFRPDETRTPDYTDFSPSWGRVFDLLTANGKDPKGENNNALFADFLVCPTEPFKEGATQSATVKAIHHPHVISRDRAGEGR